MQRACLEHLPALPGRQSRGLRTRVSRLARTGTPRTTESPLSNLGSGLSPVHRACAWWASRAQDCIAGGRPGMAGGTSGDPPRTSVAITRRKRCLGASLSIQAPWSDNRPVRGRSARTPPSRVQALANVIDRSDSSQVGRQSRQPERDPRLRSQGASAAPRIRPERVGGTVDLPRSPRGAGQCRRARKGSVSVAVGSRW